MADCLMALIYLPLLVSFYTFYCVSLVMFSELYTLAMDKSLLISEWLLCFRCMVIILYNSLKYVRIYITETKICNRYLKEEAN